MSNQQCYINDHGIKGLMLVKKGMAEKAFWKYVSNNDTKNIQRQVKAGLVKKYSV